MNDQVTLKCDSYEHLVVELKKELINRFETVCRNEQNLKDFQSAFPDLRAQYYGTLFTYLEQLFRATANKTDSTAMKTRNLTACAAADIESDMILYIAENVQ